MGDINVVDYFICGGFGGLVSVLVGHPLDTIKVRLQTDSTYKSTMDCATKTFNKDGFRGFYRGMSAPLATICPIFAISFMGFKMGKSFITQLTETEEKDYTAQHFFCAGMFSGTMTTLIMAPGERIKCLLQIAEQAASKTQNKTTKIGPLTLVKQLYREGGLRSIYRGSCATLLRDIPSTATYFATYSMLMRFATSYGGLDPCSNMSHVVTMCAGGTAGITFWLVGMPADVLKSRVQTAPTGTYPNGVRSALVVLLKNEGPLALYTGLAPVMLRAFPANAATFLGFELMRSFINWTKDISKCT